MNKNTAIRKGIIAAVATAAGLALLIVFFSVSNTYVQSVMNMLLYNIVLVLGLNFITGLTGQMNLATAGMLALGAYTYGVLTTTGGWEPWVALFALFAVGLALGRCLGFPQPASEGLFPLPDHHRLYGDRAPAGEQPCRRHRRHHGPFQHTAFVVLLCVCGQEQLLLPQPHLHRHPHADRHPHRLLQVGPRLQGDPRQCRGGGGRRHPHLQTEDPGLHAGLHLRRHRRLHVRRLQHLPQPHPASPSPIPRTTSPCSCSAAWAACRATSSAPRW